MIHYDKAYDISILLGVESTSWPGDPPYRRYLRMALADGGIADVSMLEMTAHTGTHVDSPAHFLPGGRKLDAYRVEDFILPARVVDAGDAAAVGAELVAAAGLEPGQAVLFRTANSASGRIAAGAFFGDGVYLSAEAAALCVQRRVALVGIDYFTMDAADSTTFPAHHALLEAGVPILETVNLRAVPAGLYTLICLPLRMAGAEGSPVRAVLLR
jgi:arylformamidase